MSERIFLEEYKECHRNLRYYSAIRFAEFTLFLIINGVLLNFVYRLFASNTVFSISFLGVLAFFSPLHSA